MIIANFFICFCDSALLDVDCDLRRHVTYNAHTTSPIDIRTDFQKGMLVDVRPMEYSKLEVVKIWLSSVNGVERISQNYHTEHHQTSWATEWTPTGVGCM